MAHTTVVYAPHSTPPAQRFVAMCTAVALAERARSKGDHALVVLDDLTCMVRCCPAAAHSLAPQWQCWSDRMHRQVALAPTACVARCSVLARCVGSIADATESLQVDLWETTSSWIGAAKSGMAHVADEDKVQYEGMLISAAAAEGRRSVLAPCQARVLATAGSTHRKCPFCVARLGFESMLASWCGTGHDHMLVMI